MTQNQNELLNMADLASELNVSRSTIYGWIEDNVLPTHITLGDTKYWPRKTITDWLTDFQQRAHEESVAYAEEHGLT